MMNIKQLSYSIDSLEKKLEDKEEYYSNNYTDKFNLKLSSVNDTLLKSSNTYRNKKKMDYALINKVRSLKSILKSNSDDLNHKKSIINRHKIE